MSAPSCSTYTRESPTFTTASRSWFSIMTRATAHRVVPMPRIALSVCDISKTRALATFTPATSDSSERSVTDVRKVSSARRDATSPGGVTAHAVRDGEQREVDEPAVFVRARGRDRGRWPHPSASGSRTQSRLVARSSDFQDRAADLEGVPLVQGYGSLDLPPVHERSIRGARDPRHTSAPSRVNTRACSCETKVSASRSTWQPGARPTVSSSVRSKLRPRCSGGSMTVSVPVATVTGLNATVRRGPVPPSGAEAFGRAGRGPRISAHAGADRRGRRRGTGGPGGRSAAAQACSRTCEAT